MAAGSTSPYRRLVEHVLGIEDICAYVAKRDAEGISRREQARELRDQLSEKVGRPIELSDMSLGRWCKDAGR